MNIPSMACAVLVSGIIALPGKTTETLIMPLSGQGPSDAVEWDFTVTGGRRAGEKAKIPVPSQWEQHGFGNYDYGQVPDAEKHKEDGIYRKSFVLPDDWRGRHVRIVFDGVMTDTAVTINGRSAGPVHRGGFYRFHHDITDKVVFGAENHLEVTVSKDSSNASIEGAERGADYWVFGGIFRPVWLESRPPSHIEWTAVSAEADGSLHARVYPEGAPDADAVVARLTERDGKPVGEALKAPVSGPGPVEIRGRFPGVRTWCAEEPNLYQIEFSLMRGGDVLHRTVERIGFRTFEARPGQGVFLNGRRITVKGVNRHCFRPESGRALDPRHSIEDVKLIKSMNMNSVRSSHYPPDKTFLDACDELGLYVESELCTWQKPVIDTENARRLIGQMIRRDVNHPSILWWANGNEGGWNTEVDGDYAVWDIQQRAVLHPWEEFSGYQTKHYPDWKRLQKDLAGPFLVMPTEFLHGLFDGGHGAGLEDYWNAITARPNGVGGFLWVLADEGIRRTDRGGSIDNQGILAPDGIVGPHHEKEASYHVIKDIFCPVRIDMRRLPADFNGRIPLKNSYDFRNLSGVRFHWSLSDVADGAEQSDLKTFESGELAGPSLEPGQVGELHLNLPQDWKKHRVLSLRADDAEGCELWTWSWEIPGSKPRGAAVKVSTPKPAWQDGAGQWIACCGDGVQAVFRPGDGTLERIRIDGQTIPLTNGPRLVNPSQDDGSAPEPSLERQVSRRTLEDGSLEIESASNGAFRKFAWTLRTDGALELEWVYQHERPSVMHGITFDLPQQEIVRFHWEGQGPERVWSNRMRGTRFGAFTRKFHLPEPGVDYDATPAAGYYADVDRFKVELTSGRFTVSPASGGTFIRIGTNNEGERITTFWPEGGFSILHAIPAIGNKFHHPFQTGPQGQAHPASGEVRGKVLFSFGQ